MNISPRFRSRDDIPGDWPLVAINDDGIRPAGEPDECFYCNHKVGQPHGRDCVTVTKRVLVRYVVEAAINVPHSWTAEEIVNFENHEGDSYNLEPINGAEIHAISASYIGTVDDTPRRELREEGE
ncbi:MAG TPA: hypothetical protein VFO40_11830 [Chthoniobacterales bacterium]|nr:hypothetical protein [Chthoniobacterales bacterium]